MDSNSTKFIYCQPVIHGKQQKTTEPRFTEQHLKFSLVFQILSRCWVYVLTGHTKSRNKEKIQPRFPRQLRIFILSKRILVKSSQKSLSEGLLAIIRLFFALHKIMWVVDLLEMAALSALEINRNFHGNRGRGRGGGGGEEGEEE